MTSHPAPDRTEQVLHWYDFICPFCYVGRDRSAVLASRGFTVISLPYRIHPEIPPEGMAAGPREGPMYTFLDEAAEAAGMPLDWPDRLPDTSYALAAAEWVRRHRRDAFPPLYSDLFEAHFVRGEDIGAPAVVDALAARSGVDATQFGEAMRTPAPARNVEESERAARRAGVTGTPAWLVGSRLIEGLRPRAVFEKIGAVQASPRGTRD